MDLHTARTVATKCRTGLRCAYSAGDGLKQKSSSTDA